jgi:hypothetical protein
MGSHCFSMDNFFKVFDLNCSASTSFGYMPVNFLEGNLIVISIQAEDVFMHKAHNKKVVYSIRISKKSFFEKLEKSAKRCAKPLLSSFKNGALRFAYIYRNFDDTKSVEISFIYSEEKASLNTETKVEEVVRLFENFQGADLSIKEKILGYIKT